MAYQYWFYNPVTTQYVARVHEMTTKQLEFERDALNNAIVFQHKVLDRCSRFLRTCQDPVDCASYQQTSRDANIDIELSLAKSKEVEKEIESRRSAHA